MDIIESLHYKLHVFGVSVNGSMNIFCDNGAVCVNNIRPDLALSKKHHSIPYHHEQEAVASGRVRLSKEHTLTNLADIFTKII